MKYIRKILTTCSVWLMLLFMLASCSNTDYVNVIPSNCTALLSADLSKVQPINMPQVFSNMLGTSSITDCGLDVKTKLYAFETIDGNFGLCAHVKDVDKIDDIISRLEGKNGNGHKYVSDDISFVMLQHWLLAYNSDVFVALGPIMPTAQAEAERTLRKMFNQDENMSIVSTPMYARIDTMQSPISLVAQVQSLPEKFAAPFTLGAPKDADASQIMVSASASIDNKCLHIKGATYSDNEQITNALKQSWQTFRSITPTLVSSCDARSLSALFFNVKGGEFLPLLQQNKSMQPLLAGINMAIDMDNILRSVDGDFSLSLPSSSHMFNLSSIQLTAKLAHSEWLKDIDYWKQSCPKGTHISTVAANTYCYSSSPSNNFYFGVTPSHHFVCGSSLQQALKGCQPSSHPLPQNITTSIVGQRMALLLNVDALKQSDSTGLVSSLTSALKGVHYILYTVK